MTYKNAKTTLFASLIVAMVLPFSGMNAAQGDAETQRYSPTQVSDTIKAITPYVILDENGLVQFTKDISEIPLDLETIQIASDYIEMQNSFRSQAQNNPDEKPVVSDELTEKFSEFTKDIQDKKTKSKELINDIIGFDWILPEAFAWGEVCGGAPWNPLPAPQVYLLYTIGSAVDYLLGDGYHQVPIYASGNYGNDYAKEVNAYGCYRGEMRMQGIVQTYNSFNSQGPEPNPEILEYTAPVWWWDGYVIAWHYAN